MIKSKPKTIVLCIIAALLLIWLLLSNRLISEAQNQQHEISLIRQPPLQQKVTGTSFYQIEVAEQTDMLFDTVNLAGYIYNISSATDEDATRSLIFSSQDQSYSIQLKELKSNASWYYVDIDITPKAETGFDVDFCPLGMRDGTYKLLLQVEENDIPVARADTGYIIDKVQGHASLVYRPSTPVVLPEPELQRGWTNGGLNVVSIENGVLTLTGWTIIDGARSDDTEVFIGIVCGDSTEMRQYSTTKESITYIADYFDDSNLFNAGFKAYIPDVVEENLKIYIFTSYQDEIYHCSYHFEPNGSLADMVSVNDL